MKSEKCLRCKKLVPAYALVVNISLVFFKGILGFISGSVALMADAFHSLADALCTIVTIVSLKMSAHPEDKEHPYGHGKIQYFSSAIVGFTLLTGALFLFYESFLKIIEGNIKAPGSIAILGAVISICLNEMMFRFQNCAAKEFNSPALKANAYDNRADAISSTAVLGGIVGSLAGYPVLDQFAAMFVALMVARIGLGLLSESSKGLMDTSLDIDTLKGIYKRAVNVENVKGISYLRGHSLGEKHRVDIEIEVDREIPVSQSDIIAMNVKESISRETEHIGEIMVFIMPEKVVELTTKKPSLLKKLLQGRWKSSLAS
ncbi:MAG: magnetosome biogenesis CDF transporter MamB [Candidatus Scalindua sediminis]|nr:magnetosome biogenesis CDF transporter MamB [Candidatus Scalindua sediminis]